MSLGFVIGRAGAGKTDHCLAEMRRRLADSPVEGHRLLLIVPEQAALQMERALVAEPGPGASHRGEVMGFRRLAQRIGTGESPRQALSPNGRAMTLRFLLVRLAGRLQYYRRVERFGGFVEELARSIGEFFD